jgi:hypothetical protein
MSFLIMWWRLAAEDVEPGEPKKEDDWLTLPGVIIRLRPACPEGELPGWAPDGDVLEEVGGVREGRRAADIHLFE